MPTYIISYVVYCMCTGMKLYKTGLTDYIYSQYYVNGVNDRKIYFIYFNSIFNFMDMKKLNEHDHYPNNQVYGSNKRGNTDEEDGVNLWR